MQPCDRWLPKRLLHPSVHHPRSAAADQHPAVAAPQPVVSRTADHDCRLPQSVLDAVHEADASCLCVAGPSRTPVTASLLLGKDAPIPLQHVRLCHAVPHAERPRRGLTTERDGSGPGMKAAVMLTRRSPAPSRHPNRCLSDRCPVGPRSEGAAALRLELVRCQASGCLAMFVCSDVAAAASEAETALVVRLHACMHPVAHSL